MTPDSQTCEERKLVFHGGPASVIISTTLHGFREEAEFPRNLPWTCMYLTESESLYLATYTPCRGVVDGFPRGLHTLLSDLSSSVGLPAYVVVRGGWPRDFLSLVLLRGGKGEQCAEALEFGPGGMGMGGGRSALGWVCRVAFGFRCANASPALLLLGLLVTPVVLRN